MGFIRVPSPLRSIRGPLMILNKRCAVSAADKTIENCFHANWRVWFSRRRIDVQSALKHFFYLISAQHTAWQLIERDRYSKIASLNPFRSMNVDSLFSYDRFFQFCNLVACGRWHLSDFTYTTAVAGWQSKRSQHFSFFSHAAVNRRAIITEIAISEDSVSAVVGLEINFTGAQGIYIQYAGDVNWNRWTGKD